MRAGPGARPPPPPPQTRALPGEAGGPAVLLFDGACGLCDRGVRFVHARDPKGRFRFAPLQSARGRALLRAHGLPEDALDTVVLVEEGRAHVRSTAALRVARGLRAPWPLLYACILVPRRVRDALYGAVARRRHRLAGPACAVPDASLRARMLD